MAATLIHENHIDRRRPPSPFLPVPVSLPDSPSQNSSISVIYNQARSRAKSGASTRGDYQDPNRSLPPFSSDSRPPPSPPGTRGSQHNSRIWVLGRGIFSHTIRQGCKPFSCAIFFFSTFLLVLLRSLCEVRLGLLAAGARKRVCGEGGGSGGGIDYYIMIEDSQALLVPAKVSGR